MDAEKLTVKSGQDKMGLYILDTFAMLCALAGVVAIEFTPFHLTKFMVEGTWFESRVLPALTESIVVQIGACGAPICGSPIHTSPRAPFAHPLPDRSRYALVGIRVRVSIRVGVISEICQPQISFDKSG